MKLLVISQYYYPEQFRINNICEELRNSKLSTQMIATLSAVNIADEYFKQKEENELLVAKTSEYSKRCEKHERETKELQNKIDEQANEIQRLKIEIAKLEMRR